MKTTIDSQIALRSVLKASYESLKASRPRFTQARFAAQIKLNPAVLSEILRGKRNVSRSLANKILLALEVPEAQMKEVIALFENKGAPKSRSQMRALTLEEFSLIQQWGCLAILSLIETDRFRSDPQWISRRLGTTVAETEAAIATLIKLGCVSRSRHGGLVLTHAQLTTPEGVTCENIQAWHREQLRLAEKKLKEIPAEMRDFSTMTMAIDPSRLPHAKKMLREFRRRLCRYLEGGKKVEVFSLGLQLFPLTKECP